MAKISKICLITIIFVVFNFTCASRRIDLLEALKHLKNDVSQSCEDDLAYCACLKAKGKCASDVETRGACAKTCNACEDKRENLFVRELGSLRKRFVQDFLAPQKRATDKSDDCDCMAEEGWCTHSGYVSYMKDECPVTCSAHVKRRREFILKK